MELATLSVEEVLRIHEILVADFAASGDPISPPGVRSQALLESAVGRQFTGSRNALKYPRPIENAATLLFGLVNDHPFHNGNKRTGLVAMLVHLDKNRLALFDTRQDALYGMVLRVAEQHDRAEIRHSPTGTPQSADLGG
jgi:death-on-curing protein